jgi:ATP synthase protein I
MQKTSTNQIRRILLMQFLATITLSVMLLAFDQTWFWSALAGGMIATLTNMYFAWRVFVKSQESAAEKILVSYYGAEVSKIILTVMLFTAAIVMIKPLSMITLISVYFFNQFVPALVSLIFTDDSVIRSE